MDLWSVINATQLRELIVRPALKLIGLHSLAAENLVMGTAAQESHLEYLKQLGGGPALGLFQVEPFTYDDYWENFVDDREDLRDSILAAIRTTGEPQPDRVIWDLRYAAIMCRIHYRRIPKPLPEAGDVWAMAAYWKRYYNTVHGAGTEQEFVDNYRRVQ